MNTSDLKSIADSFLETVVCVFRCEADEGKAKHSPASMNHVADPRRPWEVGLSFGRVYVWKKPRYWEENMEIRKCKQQICLSEDSLGKSNVQNSVFRQKRLGHILMSLRSTKQSNVNVDIWRVVPGKYVRTSDPLSEIA